MKEQSNFLIQTQKLYRAGFEGAFTLGVSINAVHKTSIDPALLFSPSEMRGYAILPEERKLSFLQGRYIAKHCLLQVLEGRTLHDINIINGIFGQPILEGHSDLNLSITHTSNASGCIVFPRVHPMGIDLQHINYDNTENINSQLTTDEKNIPGVSNLHTHLWACKEALSKILKTGLLLPFSVLEIQNMELCEGFYISYFRNFSQYKAISFGFQQKIIAIVLPARTYINVHEILQKISSIAPAYG